MCIVFTSFFILFAANQFFVVTNRGNQMQTFFFKY